MPKSSDSSRRRKEQHPTAGGTTNKSASGVYREHTSGSERGYHPYAPPKTFRDDLFQFEWMRIESYRAIDRGGLRYPQSVRLELRIQETSTVHLHNGQRAEIKFSLLRRKPLTLNKYFPLELDSKVLVDYGDEAPTLMSNDTTRGVWRNIHPDQYYLAIPRLWVYDTDATSYEYEIGASVRFEGLSGDFSLPSFTFCYLGDSDRPSCRGVWSGEEFIKGEGW